MRAAAPDGPVGGALLLYDGRGDKRRGRRLAGGLLDAHHLAHAGRARAAVAQQRLEQQLLDHPRRRGLRRRTPPHRVLRRRHLHPREGGDRAGARAGNHLHRQRRPLLRAAGGHPDVRPRGSAGGDTIVGDNPLHRTYSHHDRTHRMGLPAQYAPALRAAAVARPLHPRTPYRARARQHHGARSSAA